MIWHYVPVQPYLEPYISALCACLFVSARSMWCNVDPFHINPLNKQTCSYKQSVTTFTCCFSLFHHCDTFYTSFTWNSDNTYTEKRAHLHFSSLWGVSACQFLSGMWSMSCSCPGFKQKDELQRAFRWLITCSDDLMSALSDAHWHWDLSSRWEQSVCDWMWLLRQPEVRPYDNEVQSSVKSNYVFILGGGGWSENV